MSQKKKERKKSVENRDARESLAFSVLLLVSGFCGISYEILYSRGLGNLMGDQMAVSASILITFLLGIGIGTLWAHRLWRHLWLIEISIGVCGILFAFSNGIIDHILYASIPVIGGGLVSSVFLCCLLLVVPSMLIGCSLPLFAGYLGRLQGGRVFQRAYTIYNFGAALTAILIEFWIVRTFGLRGALLAIAMLNFLVGGVLKCCFDRLSRLAPPPSEKVVVPWNHKTTIAIVSIASAVFQLMMIKVAECIVGPFHETFALALAIVLLGLAVGSAVCAKRVIRLNTVVACGLIGIVWILAGTEVVCTIYASLYESAAHSHLAMVLLKFSALTMLMGLPATCFGATIPALLQNSDSVARDSGELLFISSIANAFGFVLMTFLLHPYMDYGTILVTVACLLAASVAVNARFNRWATMAAICCAVATIFIHQKCWDEELLYVGHDSFHDLDDLHETREQLSLARRFKGHQDVFAITEIDGDPYFFINGYISIPLNSASEKIVGAFSSIFAPRDDKALVLGVGSGATAGTVGRLFGKTDTIEINPVVLENLHRMSEHNFQIEENPNVNIFQDDAVHFVKRSEEQYSLIINTVTTPLYFSSSKLYTDEFLNAVAKRLTDDGIYVTWFDSRVGDEGLDIVLKTISNSFDHCALGAIKSCYFLLICSDKPIEAHQPHIVAQQPMLSHYFSKEHQYKPEWLPYGLVCSDALSLIGDKNVSVNSLDYPSLEFSMSRLRDDGIPEFIDRLVGELSLEEHQAALSRMDWDCKALLMHNEELHGTDSITECWYELVRQDVPRIGGQMFRYRLSYYEEFAKESLKASAHRNYADELVHHRRFKEAVQEYERVLELDPEYTVVYGKLSKCFHDLEDLPQALKHVETALTFAPGNSGLSLQYAKVLLDMKRYDDCLLALDDAPESDSYDVRATALDGLGRIAEAEAERQKSRLDPRSRNDSPTTPNVPPPGVRIRNASSHMPRGLRN